MLLEPLFLTPVFQDRIWGGTRLRELFGYDIPTETTGECWGISALSHGPSIIKNGVHKGKTLETVWKENPELFDHYKSKDFPLLTKILDAKTDLSVQVHPDDHYAQEKEHQPFGKTECWYIIDCEEGAEIVFGHEAHSPEEFQEMVDKGQWNNLLRKVKVKPGDFFYVPSGTIHAIGGGILILESQQSSDITYRVYDYDRKDVHGNKRELHIQQSIDVTHYPHEDPTLTYHVKQEDQAVFTELCHEKYFSVSKWDIRGQSKTIEKGWPFLLASVIAGSGDMTIDGQKFQINKGDHFIIPASVDSFSLNGQAELIVSYAV
ncbi:mannose-6-phosphate isomerase, class I [Terrilactibacillus sp. BCM23-1]|uniref:Mannose-6-phosphate isomerase n=1 Tax=Terrilactibacillus tamarindi TaxID=2599694 RepID=A0A6N8CRH5_9BACI|nr:mannose-6-phosphate isomerase, class I [Terrilactibacillus tamarindi]MTT31535.1 mannose-6-phosphate isomerase, class I [Terrilactibacillus tamarindi]